MISLFDILLVLIALIVTAIGFLKRCSSWLSGRGEAISADWAGLIGYILGHRRVLETRKRGVVHLIFLWGFVSPLLVIILAQFGFSIPFPAARAISLLMDLLGFCLFFGAIYFMINRIKSMDRSGPQKTLFPISLILIIIITGFLAEGTRLSIINSTSLCSTPVGWMLSGFMPPSPLVMSIMIRLHFLAVLVFIATLPYTYSRHIIIAPLNILFRRKGNPGLLRNVSFEAGITGAGSIKDFSWKQLLDVDACVSCGRCDENCPAFISGKPLSPRNIVRQLITRLESAGSEGIIRIPDEEIWSCSSCLACVTHCPVYVEPMDKIMDMRRFIAMGKGQIPSEARPMIRNLELFGDVQGKGASHRMDYACDLHLPQFDSGGLKGNVLLWVGCSGAFHPRYQDVVRAMVNIMRKAGIPFAVLGAKEYCCGDPARRVGEEKLFIELAKKNIEQFRGHGVKEIVCLCPHCYNSLKNEYPLLLREGLEQKTPWEVFHASEFIMRLIREGTIKPRYSIEGDMAFHDPCYLGRANNLYDPPREMMKSMPGSSLMELERHHTEAFCCGGGGGMWFHENSGRRLNTMRAEEVLDSGVNMLGTACPYCMTMLEDGINSLGKGEEVRVMDIVEIINYSI